MKIAILIDGAFYQKQANKLFGHKSPRDRADELEQYCHRHVKASERVLYRIFYYDCPPSEKVVFHPLTQKNVSLKKSALYKWSTEFHSALLKKRSVAFRRGELLESSAGYA